MSVLYVLKRYPRLSETFVVREIAELEQRGLRVGIDALLPPEPGPGHPLVETVNAPVRYVARRPRLRRRPALAAHVRIARGRPLAWALEAVRAYHAGTWRRFVQAGLVADRARRDGFTSIHAHFATAATEVAAHASALAALPFTVTAHAKDIFTEENAAALSRRVGNASAVVTVSTHNREHLRRVLPSTPVHVIRNGVPLAAPADVPASGPVLCVARLVEKKGIDVLLAAFARVRDARPSARLEVIGDGPLLEPLRALAARLGIDHAVAFRGAQPPREVEAAYRRCALVALPCRVSRDGDRDGMPTVLVEALGHGLPVVTTDIVGIGELVRHRATGLLVPPEDADALATAIVELLGDRALATRLGAAGRQLVGTDYDPADSAEQLRCLFAEVSR
jgi:glycosyltransferase involved in cell wall biosynthesis